MRLRTGLLLALLAGAGGCVFGTFDDITRSGAVRPSPARCGECHEKIYEEWSASTHATAWTDARYTTATSDHAIAGCAPCHAPDSLYAGGPLAARAVDPAHGVDCVACHLDEGALVGPLPSTAVLRPHPIREARPMYERSDLCGRCHEGTFDEWKTVAAGAAATRTCQQCHMPPVVRKVTQADDVLSSVLVAMEKTSAQRQHRFDLGAVADFPDAARLAIAPAGAALAVTIENRLPHALPTGDYGPRSVELRIAFATADGTPAGEATIVRSARRGGAIPALESVTETVEPPAGAVAATAVLVRPSAGPEGDLVLARAEVRW